MIRRATRTIRTAAAMSLVAVAALAAQEPTPSGAFIMHIGADTLVIERFGRSADTLHGSVAFKGQPRMDYAAVTGPGETVPFMSLDVFAASAAVDAAPLQHVRVTMRGDSALAEINGTVRGFATARGALPLMNNSFAMAELYTQRARAMGGSVDIPVWALSGGTNLVISVRSVGQDSMTLTLAGQEQRLHVDRAGRILGGVIPAQHLEIIRVNAAVAATLRLGKTDYSAPADAPYTATEVTLTGQGGIVLGGTLTLPKGAKGPVPAVVTITGSGQQDRDEYVAIVPGGYRPFRQVADTLARRGIAVLRLDDRTVGLSGGKIGTSADYADDIRAALGYLRTRSDIDGARLALIGHSEGGMIAPMIAATDPTLKGIVLLAGPALTGFEISHFQQRDAIAHDSRILPAARDSAARVAAATLDSLAAQDVWLGFFTRYDPLPTARRVTVPTLILQGATDHQVTPDQADKIAAAMRSGGNRDVTVRIFPQLNHLFVHDPSGEPSGYTKLTSNRVAPEVLGLLADWLVARLNPGKI